MGDWANMNGFKDITAKSFRIGCYTWATAAFWTVLVAASLAWSANQVGKATLEMARIQARSAFMKDVVFRRWCSLHGGTYVPVTKDTPPNPYLANIPERDIHTPSGKQLTLINPAYMTRNVFELGQKEYGILAHITSARPIRPENAPDPWESVALQAFERGDKEISSVETIDGHDYLRLIQPLITEQSCLLCHAKQGYQLNDIRGGISVAIPMQPLWAISKVTLTRLVLVHGILWILGIGGTVFGARKLKQIALKRHDAEIALQNFRDHLEQKVHKRTAELTKANEVIQAEIIKRKSTEKNYRDLYENAPDMFVSVDADTRNVLQCNETLASELGHTKEEIIGKSVFDIYHPDCLNAVQTVFQTFVSMGEVRNAELQLRRKDGSKIDVSLNVSAVRNADGKILHSRSILRNITERKQVNYELCRKNRSLRALSTCIETILNADDEAILLSAICRVIVEKGGYCLAWIGYAEKDERNTVRPVAQAGFEDGYLDTINITWDDTDLGRGPTGTAIRTGRPILACDLLSDPDFIPWRVEALKRGYASSMALPLVNDEDVIGALNIYAAEPNAFDSSEIDLLMEMSGALAYGITTLRSRAARVDSEKTLQKIQALLNETQRITKVGGWEYDVGASKLTWTDEVYRIYGVSQATYDPNDIDQNIRFYAPEDQNRIARAFRAAVEEAKPYNLELQFHSADGRILWVRTIGQVAQEGGKVVRVFGNLMDITERKQVQLALMKSEERFKQAVENIPDVIVIYDTDLRIRYINAATRHVTGRPVSDFIGKRDDEIWPPEVYKVYLPMLSEALNTRTIRSVEADLVLPNVARRNLRIICVPLIDNRGNVREVLGITQDFTDRVKSETEIRHLNETLKRYAEELEQRVAHRTAELVSAKEHAESADRLKSVFLSTMSHELRTPLNSIIGFTGILLKGMGGPLNAEQTKQLRMVQNSGRHLLNLINDVLDISKIEAGQLELSHKPFGLRHVVLNAVEFISPLAEKSGVTVQVEIVADIAQIMGDQRRTEQILINLLSNAVKFTPKGGMIGIRVEMDQKTDPGYRAQTNDGLSRRDWVRISIQDTGIGLTPEDMDKIFKPFRQIDAGMTRQFDGTGLGLSICKRLVEMLGGEIRAESEGTDKGSLFSFTLPVM